MNDQPLSVTRRIAAASSARSGTSSARWKSPVVPDGRGTAPGRCSSSTSGAPGVGAEPDGAVLAPEHRQAGGALVERGHRVEVANGEAHGAEAGLRVDTHAQDDIGRHPVAR